MEWLGQSEYIKTQNEEYIKTVDKLTDSWNCKFVRTFVLKGLACAKYYPRPELRSLGDFDCFLTTDQGDHNWAYDEGNKIAGKLDAEVEFEHYKHSHISYNGISIENHKFCIGIRGESTKKKFERHLESLLVPDSLNQTGLNYPCADFNALLLTHHAFRHFMNEGLPLRQIMDWAMFLRSEQKNVDWKEFYRWTDKVGITRFANVMNAIAREYLGVKIESEDIVSESPYAERILNDALNGRNALFSKGYTGLRFRWEQLRNAISYTWKYHKIYHRLMLLEYFRGAWAFLFEREPRL